jgi:hypothetical protein
VSSYYSPHPFDWFRLGLSSLVNVLAIELIRHHQSFMGCSSWHLLLDNVIIVYICWDLHVSRSQVWLQCVVLLLFDVVLIGMKDSLLLFVVRCSGTGLKTLVHLCWCPVHFPAFKTLVGNRNSTSLLWLTTLWDFSLFLGFLFYFILC